MISLHEIAKDIKLEKDEQDKDKKVYKTDGGMWAGDYDGDIEYFDDEEKAKHWSQKGDMEFSDDGGDSKDDEDSAGKLGGSDFERDGADEPKSEPKSEPKDTTGSIAGNEDAIDFAQALAQGNETNRSYQGLKDAGHEDLAKAIYNADSEEEKFDLVRKASEESDEPESKSSGSDKSDGEPTGSKEEIKKAKEELAQAQEYYDESKEELKMTQDPNDEERVRKYVAADFEELQRAKKKLAKLQGAKKESITINGKQYRPIKESKKFNKRVLKENYDRFFGDKK